MKASSASTLELHQEALRYERQVRARLADLQGETMDFEKLKKQLFEGAEKTPDPEKALQWLFALREAIKAEWEEKYGPVQAQKQ